MAGDPPKGPPDDARFSPSFSLVPKPGFNWLAVSWGGPAEPVALACSYCEAPFGEGEMPLILWNPEGWCAQFCEACQLQWWGIERLA